MKIDERLIQQLVQQLKTAVGDTRHFETAQIQVIGLDDVRRRAGAMWPELSARVRGAAAEFINRRIGEHDIVIPAGDGFLVIYAEPTGAREKSAALQEALDTFYLGEESMRGVQVNVAHHMIESEALFKTLSTPAAVVPPRRVAQGLRLMPVWSTAQQAITGYWVAPAGDDGLGAYLGYSRTWSDTGRHRDGDDFLELDLLILKQAIAEAQGSLRRERRCLIGYSVHATTMLDRARRLSYFQALAATPGDVRPYLLGRVAELEIGTPIARVTEWVGQLRAVSQRMAIQLHHSQKDVGGLQDVGVFSVACVMPSFQTIPQEIPGLERTVQTWAKTLKRDGLKLRLDNVTSPRLLSYAVQAGADFCSSEILWPVVTQADGMRPYSRDRFDHTLLQRMGQGRMSA